MMEEVKIEKLVHGGQGIGTLKDGRKVFVWGSLPSETVEVELWRSKKNYAEGQAIKILTPSKDRIEPIEQSYLGTSPWQILDFEAENRNKVAIIKEVFEHESVSLPDFKILSDGKQYGYRNKMEYSFWADDNGLHLALYNRGSHQKNVINGSALALPKIDIAANEVLQELNKNKIEGRQLKTVVIRCTQSGGCVAALFVKDENFPKIELPKSLSGLAIYYSNPKSPASVITKLLHQTGSISLEDKLLTTNLSYTVTGFFQVNIPVFRMTLKTINDNISSNMPIVDMYSGVGSIGLSVGQAATTLVELDPSCVEMAKKNAGAKAIVVHASTEKALDYITNDAQIILDPPRAGLHADVCKRLLEVVPPKIIYLSCNPATQSRDIAILSQKYNISYFEAYNYFPRTPHIETLAVLVLK